jgi:TonB family protein
MAHEDYLRALQVLDRLELEERTRFWERIGFFQKTRKRNFTDGSSDSHFPHLRRRWSKPLRSEEPQTRPLDLSDGHVDIDGDLDRRGPKAKRRFSFSLLTSLVCGIVIVITGVAAARYHSILDQTLVLIRGPEHRPLGLKVEQHSDGSLLLQWDSDAMKMMKAKVGFLTIQDGTEQRTLRLDSNQLSSGVLMYSPATRDLSFRLNVMSDRGQQLSAVLRVVKHSITPQRSDRPELGNAGISAKMHENESARHVREPELANRVIGDNAPTAIRGLPTDLQENASYEMRSSGAHGIGANGRTSAKSGIGTTATSVRAELQRQGVAKGASTSQELKILNSLSETHSLPAVARASETNNSGARISERVYVPPRPLKRVPPKPADYHYVGLPRPVDIVVEVRIDAQGYVTEAHVVDSDSEENVLANSALVAAKSWIFEPALVDGKRVPSDHRIAFHFRPQTE